MCGGGYAPPTGRQSVPRYARRSGLGHAVHQATGKGIAQKISKPFTAGQSHRRTSDGKAEVTLPKEILGKARNEVNEREQASLPDPETFNFEWLFRGYKRMQNK